MMRWLPLTDGDRDVEGDRQKASLVDTDKEHNDDDENNNHDEWQYVGKTGRGQRGNMTVFWLYVITPATATFALN